MQLNATGHAHRRAHQDRWGGLRTKTMLIMNGMVIFLLAAAVQVSATGRAQTVTYTAHDAPLRTVLTEIERQTGYVFFYEPREIQDVPAVSVQLHRATLNEALAKVAGQWLDFDIQGNTIMLTRKIIRITQNSDTTQRSGGVISGLVRGEGGAPLAGASVTISFNKAKQSAITNGAGEFTFKGVASGRYNVEVSFIGYERFISTVNLEGQKVVVVADLKQATSTLDETVVIPYGTTTERLNTGNVSKVTSKEIEKQPVANVLAALEGRVPGLVITQTTGMPGGGFNIQIRGQNSLINGNSPFIVIDGVPYPNSIPSALGGSYFLINGSLNGSSPLNYINPHDIESVEVLKDADATAIYGSRAANGAILITTKKAKAGPMRISINANTGFSSPTRGIRMMNTQQFLATRREAFQNDGITTIPATNYDLTFWDTTRYTNWGKVLLQNRAPWTDVNASVSGGTANTQILIGGGFRRQTTGLPRTFDPQSGGDQIGTVHLNLSNSSLDKRFKVSITASYAADLNAVTVDLANLQLFLAPNAPSLYNPDGTLNWEPKGPGIVGTWTNPLATLNQKYRQNTTNLTSNVSISYIVLPGLTVGTTLGYNILNVDEVSTYPSTSIDPNNHTTMPSSNFNTDITRSWIVEPQINYRLNLGKGLLTALAGATIHEKDDKGQYMSASNYINDGLLENPQAAGSIQVYSQSSQYKYAAVFSRINYSWEDKYIIDLNARRDGSSRFGPGRQFGNFGSVGAAWIFSKERWFRKKSSFLSFGKLRASYGTTGNDQIGDYKFLDLYSAGTAYLGSPSLVPTSLYNPDLAWELDKKLEGGLELGFFKDRIYLKASYFRNRSGNQLISLPLSAVTGFGQIPANLSAVVQNSGQEIELRTVNIKTKHFTWSTEINITIPRNKLLSYSGLAKSGYASSYVVGKPITIVKLFPYMGVNDSSGLFQFKDAKGNLTYTPTQITDQTEVLDLSPKYYGGFLNRFSYKGFSTEIFFQFTKQTGRSIFGVYGRELGTMANFPEIFVNHWRKPGDKVKYQKAGQSSSVLTYRTSNNAGKSALAYTDASYIRLKNLSVSWQVPDNWKQRMHVQNLQFFMNAQNLLTITKYNGVDPESPAIYSAPKKVWTAGFQLIF